MSAMTYQSPLAAGAVSPPRRREGADRPVPAVDSRSGSAIDARSSGRDTSSPALRRRSPDRPPMPVATTASPARLTRLGRVVVVLVLAVIALVAF